MRIMQYAAIAEVRIGELMREVPKATPNNNPFHEKDSGVVLVKPKAEVIREAGFTPKLSDAQQTYLRGKMYEARKKSQGGDRRSEEFSKDQIDPLNKSHSTA